MMLRSCQRKFGLCFIAWAVADTDTPGVIGQVVWTARVAGNDTSRKNGGKEAPIREKGEPSQSTV